MMRAIGHGLGGAVLGLALLAAVVSRQTCMAASASRPGAEAPPPAGAWLVPDIDRLPDTPWSRTVRLGRDLIVRTYALIGPETANPAMRFAGNNLACENCHFAAGTKKFGQPLIGVFADFPQYRSRDGRVGTIEDRLNGCMRRSMNGRPLPLDSKPMVAMVAYLKFLSTGIPVGAKTAGRGDGRMPELSRPADPVRGKAVYAANCTVCHGANGEGHRRGAPGDAKGYDFPPLWGPDSFNDGAGMHRLITAANFVHSNMPNGTHYDAPALAVADAWDVAAYINTQPRPHMAHLDRDYPNLLEKPVDAPFGPYADQFTEAQHRFGPFAPIRDAIERLKRKAPGTLPSRASTAR